MDAQEISFEPDVTCLVGKNESGKTTILQALHRLNPANGSRLKFQLVGEYPMAKLARERGGATDLEPVSARFSLEERDFAALEKAGYPLPEGTPITITASRTYSNELRFGCEVEFSNLIRSVKADAGLNDEDLGRLLDAADMAELELAVNELARELRGSKQPARGNAVAKVPELVRAEFGDYVDGEISSELNDELTSLLPKFFYFSDYEILPGSVDLSELAERLRGGGAIQDREETVLALLSMSGAEPSDFLDEDYISRKSELQSAAAELSQSVFAYWKSNQDLAVTFDTDMPVVGQDIQGRDIRHRFLKIELRDDRHGGVETNFDTRSAGFQWFFSFFAAFWKYQSAPGTTIVLLDEPGTSLHGEAQRDFLAYISGGLAEQNQVVYTTHSQHMIDPAKYERLRAVHDQASRSNPLAGVEVTTVSLASDRDTLLPIEAAIGYSVAQHLFLGSGRHLVVEGSSDFVYLERLSALLSKRGRAGLDPSLAIIPVGGIDNVAPFVALLGRRLEVSVLVDGPSSSRQFDRISRAAEAIGVPNTAIVRCSEAAESLPGSADVEDLFLTDDYLWLYEAVFGAVDHSRLADTHEPIMKRLTDAFGSFDHAVVAHTLTERLTDFEGIVSEQSLGNFEALFGLLNATVKSQG